MSFRAYLCWFLLFMRFGGNMALIDAWDFWKMRSYGHMNGWQIFFKGVSLLDLGEDRDES